MEPDDPSSQARDQIRDSGSSQFPVEIPVPVDYLLDPGGVQKERHEGHDEQRHDIRALSEDLSPIGPGRRLQRPRLPPAGPSRERSQEPSTRLSLSHADPADPKSNEEDRQSREDRRGNEEEVAKPSDQQKHDHREEQTRKPLGYRFAPAEGVERRHRQRRPGQDSRATLEQEPTGTCQKATHHGVGDEPDEVSEPESSQEEEGDPRENRRESDHGHDREERLLSTSWVLRRDGRSDESKDCSRAVLHASHGGWKAGEEADRDHDHDGSREHEGYRGRDVGRCFSGEDQRGERRDQDNLDDPDHQT